MRVFNDPLIIDNAHPMITRSKAGVLKPKTYNATVSYAHEPVSLKAALSSSTWLQAMQDEYWALLIKIKHGVSLLCPLVLKLWVANGFLKTSSMLMTLFKGIKRD